MDKTAVEERLRAVRIIPVVVLNVADDALPLADALSRGGLPCAEVTFRTAAGRAGIEKIAREFPDFIVGAGTVTTPDEVTAAMQAGAHFGVAPGCSARTLVRAKELDFPFFPGVMTPTEIEFALSHGHDLLKFFPAQEAGGTRMLRALHAPYKHRGVRFIPTGGIQADHLAEYLGEPSVVAVGGSWIIAPLKDRDWERVTDLARDAVALAVSCDRAVNEGR